MRSEAQETMIHHGGTEDTEFFLILLSMISWSLW
jgi:hypothetical protein